MTEPRTPAGWYPAPHANNEMRYWDGTRWLDWTPQQAAQTQQIRPGVSQPAGQTYGGVSTAELNGGGSQPQVGTPGTSLSGGAETPYPGLQPIVTPKNLAVLALCFGIGAFVVAWVPWLGLILALTAVGLGIFALVRKQAPGLALTGLILGAFALVAALLVTVSFTAFLSNSPSGSNARSVPDVATTPEASDPAPSDEGGAATPEPTPEPVAPAAPDLAAFGTVDARAFALIAKEPDSHVGTNLIVFGEVSQLDSATGPCVMLLSAAESQKEMSFEYEQNSMATSGDGESECPVFDPLVEGDHVKMWVTVLGSLSYDTQIGGNTTVPAFEVWQAELLPAQEY